MNTSAIAAARSFTTLHAVLALAVLLAGLAGCDDAARGAALGEPCGADGDCRSGLVCDAELGVCVTDLTTRDAVVSDVPDLEDIGVDTDEPDTGGSDTDDLVDDTDGPCTDGATRQCGLPVGECTVGEQTCEGGVWGTCSGLPPSEEICDGLDNDCDGGVDQTGGVSLQQSCGSDEGECVAGVETCAMGAWGSCKESQGPVDEVCDGLDNDCNGAIDDGATDTTTFYRDDDGDGFGQSADTVEACAAPTGYAALDGDCDDTTDMVYPGAVEICDGLDNDCNTLVDDAAMVVTWYRDADADGYGDPGDSLSQCAQPTGYVLDDTDCNDDPAAGGAQQSPGAAELCDGVDNDCDATSPDGSAEPWLAAACDGPDTDLCAEGAYACAGGVQVCSDTTTDDLELCNGLDDDCDPSTADGAAEAWLGAACDGPDTDLCAEGTYGCVGGTQSCSDVSSNTLDVCNGLDDDCDPSTADGSGSAWIGSPCDGPDTDLCTDGVLGCTGGAQTCGDDAASSDEVCGDGLDNDCDGQTDEGCNACNPAIDNDFDGSNECDDCDDTNGAAYPGNAEICDGVDNDCDLAIDEDFDVDVDTFSVCSQDPLVRDCDDDDDTVYPGAAELCDGKDNDCDGYVDEGCGGCNPVDTDGDGVSECDGDCNPGNGTVFPGATEVCDDLDNDCNRFTRENCDVSDPCNFDGDGSPTNDVDTCEGDLICACIVNAAGTCQGDYRCTAFCNTSDTGARGDGCAPDQTCFYDLLRSANIHGCAVSSDPVGTRGGGEVCTADSQCRSNNCDRLCVGPGCNTNYCQDYCGSDDYCGTGAVCRLSRGTSNMDGRCWPSGGPLLGTSAVGATCTADSQCDHGFCQQLSGRCTEACCKDSDCPGGYTCSLRGDGIDTTFGVQDPNGAACTTSATCPTGQACVSNVCGWIVTETAPQCVPDVAGQGSRQGGAACSQNSDCASNFCDATLSVCVETCCSDATCPTGLFCEQQTVEAGANRVTSARICVNVSTDNVFLRK